MGSRTIPEIRHSEDVRLPPRGMMSYALLPFFDSERRTSFSRTSKSHQCLHVMRASTARHIAAFFRARPPPCRRRPGSPVGASKSPSMAKINMCASTASSSRTSGCAHNAAVPPFLHFPSTYQPVVNASVEACRRAIKLRVQTFSSSSSPSSSSSSLLLLYIFVFVFVLFCFCFCF